MITSSYNLGSYPSGLSKAAPKNVCSAQTQRKDPHSYHLISWLLGIYWWSNLTDMIIQQTESKAFQMFFFFVLTTFVGEVGSEVVKLFAQ